MKRLAPHLDAFVQTGAVPGLIAAVVTPDDVTLHTAGTMPGASEPPGPTTLFRVGSLSKIFTVVALADLIAEGRIRLDDSVETLLGAKMPGPDGAAITVEHLAVHTSGLPTGAASDQDRRAALEGGWPYVLPRLAALPVAGKPGEVFVYSNIGMAILGNLVERADGRPYEDVIRARVLDPLGMSSTRATLLPGMPVPLFHEPTGIFAAAGGFFSNLSDLILFAQATLAAISLSAPSPVSGEGGGEGGGFESSPGGGGRPRSASSRSGDRDRVISALSSTYGSRGSDSKGRPLYLGWHEDKSSRLMHSGLWHAYLGIDRTKQFALVMLLTGQTSVNDALGSAAMSTLAGEPALFPDGAPATT